MVNIIRTYKATIQKKCCRGDEIVYNPPDREFKIKDSVDSKIGFQYSLVIWKDKIENRIKRLARSECRQKGTPKLCHFKIKKAHVKELIEKEIEITDIEIQRARQLIKTYEETIARLTWMREDFMRKINEIRTKYREYGIEL